AGAGGGGGAPRRAWPSRSAPRQFECGENAVVLTRAQPVGSGQCQPGAQQRMLSLRRWQSVLAEQGWWFRCAIHRLVGQEKAVGSQMQDARAFELLEHRLAGLALGEHVV